MGIVFGCIVPHPPIIIPDIGRGQERVTQATITALEKLSQELASHHPQSLVVISPHGQAHYDAMGLLTAHSCRGDLRSWGSRTPELRFENDQALAVALQKEARAAGIPLSSIGEKGYDLDHGVMVPLFYLIRGIKGLPLLPLTFSWLPLEAHFAFGLALHRAVLAVGKRVAVIASGDLSHRLLPEAPAGFHPQGKVFDNKLVRAIEGWDKEAILKLDPELVEKAGECGLRSIVILLGALEGLKVQPQVLSYEGPFGVGYLVATVPVQGADPTPQAHPLVALARKAVEGYILTGKVLSPPRGLSPQMKDRAGVFVSLKKFGELRGCIGTYEPARGNVAEEVIANAIGSATRDPRFLPVMPEELPYLDYSVDVLTSPRLVKDIKELDPKRLGVIVECGWKKGLLLPDLEGVNTVEEQITICCHKAGISPQEPLTLYCFEVKRYK